MTYSCPHCGKAHEVTAGLELNPSPGQAGTVAQLLPGGNLPPTVAALLGDLVWCDGQAEYLSMADPARVTVTPPAKAEIDNAEGQSDQLSDLDAGEDVEGSTSA